MAGLFSPSKKRILLCGCPLSFEAIIGELAKTTLARKAEIVLVCNKKKEAERLAASFRGRLSIQLLEGRPDDPAILARAAKKKLTSICVNGYGTDQGDTMAINTVSALLSVMPDEEVASRTLVITDSAEARATIKAMGNRKIRCLSIKQFFPRIIAQTARQANLQKVYGELFSFEGNEIYLIQAGKLAGLSYSRSLRAFNNACVIGVKKEGTVRLNPPMNTVIQADDELIVIAGCISDIRANPAIIPAPVNSEYAEFDVVETQPESFLMLGWNDFSANTIQELDQYCAPGSRVRVACVDAQAIRIPERLAHLSVSTEMADPADLAYLTSIPWEQFEHVLITGNTRDEDRETATILHKLLGVLAVSGFTNHITAVSNAIQLQKTILTAPDFLSVNLIYRMAAQLLLHPDLIGVFKQLTLPEGAEIYLKAAESYIKLNMDVHFYTILEAAKKKNETAIGYVVGNPARVILNPPKESAVRFQYLDRIIVVADT